MENRQHKIAGLLLLLLIPLTMLTGCSLLRNDAILVPPDTPKWVKGFVSMQSHGETVYCLKGEETNETVRYIRDTCLICHEFDPTQPFPKPAH